MTESENTGFLYPFIESEETDATVCSTIWRPRRGVRPPKAHVCKVSRWTSTPTR